MRTYEEIIVLGTGTHASVLPEGSIINSCTCAGTPAVPAKSSLIGYCNAAFAFEKTPSKNQYQY